MFWCSSFSSLPNLSIWFSWPFYVLKLRKEFNSDVNSVISALGGLSATSPSGCADLTHLFRLAALEAKKSRVEGRLFRVVSLFDEGSTIS